MTDLKKELAKGINEKNIIEDADMREYTSFKAGGYASLLVIPSGKNELKFALKTLYAAQMPYMIMGNGSNILVRDGGYKGTLIKLGEPFAFIRTDKDIIHAGCGALMSQVANEALKKGLGGFEFAGGIPGSIGGAVFMNAGAYGGEMKDIIKCVNVISRDGEREYEMVPEKLQLEYRHSIFCDSCDIIESVKIKLHEESKDKIKSMMKELTERRNNKQPLSLPSAGSFFKRPKGYYAGRLIEDAGLKGLTVGGAQVSQLHAGFIVNKGGATASDIIELMHMVQATVMDKYGVMLEPEVRIIGEEA